MTTGTGMDGQGSGRKRLSPWLVIAAVLVGMAVSSAGIISLNRDAPRAARYQLARFSEWLENGPERWQFLLTPASLAAAAARHRARLGARHGGSGLSASSA